MAFAGWLNVDWKGWRDLANRLGFGIRSSLQWQRGQYHEPAESKDGLFDASELRLQEERLVDDYNLSRFRKRSGRVRYQENLTCLEHLEQLVPDARTMIHALSSADQPCRWLDVGCKNASTADAMMALMARYTAQWSWTGVELDAYRMYADGYSRIDYAQGYLRDYPNTRYIPGDVMEHYGQYEFVSVFLPFVFLDPCRKWSLPDRFFQPEAFLQHVWSLVAPGGCLILVNQGVLEAEEQGRLLSIVLKPELDRGSIRLYGPVELKSRFSPYKHTRYGWLCQKTISPNDLLSPSLPETVTSSTS